jgi:predicted helicase
MSKQQINSYYTQLDKLKRYGGSHNETSIRRAFSTLVNSYAERRNLLLVEEIGVKGKKGNTVYPDGVLKNATRFEFGYWESKDSKDKIDFEINKKLNIDGYPDSNILFEDTSEAVLIQEGQLVQRVLMQNADELDSILEHFINYEPSIVQDFNRALDKFKQDIPAIVADLRDLIQNRAEINPEFVEKRDRFFELAQTEINPEITKDDIREMIIQHILTEDIFNNVFGNANFHHFNNIARELEGVINSFMNYGERQTHLQAIRSYYDTIRDASSGLVDHHEKQKFLKNIYENFYKVYNPKGADRLGVVYTPNEIVRFMIDGVDWLLDKHFGRSLGDKNVEILDPATGTGTFVVELIEYLSPQDLLYKYENELHANEVAILPYYIANLNIEFTYQQKTGEYREFRNICFVDTLDNTDPLDFEGKTKSLHFGISHENSERIRRQNDKRISVIIGNPPYNANQKNFNEFNANRKYPFIDRRFKDTFVRFSRAKKHKFDMYLRFYRYAMDRLDDRIGIIAFVTNRGFLTDKSADGFRRVVQENFDFAYIVDTRSDVIDNPKIAGTTHNLFGIKEGVAITFLIKKERKTNQTVRNCRINYISLVDEWKRQEKLQWLRDNPVKSIHFEKLEPTKTFFWLNNPTDNDFDDLVPLLDEDVKWGKRNVGSIFSLYSLGIATNRDEWVYDHSSDHLQSKIRDFIGIYETRRAALFSMAPKNRNSLIEDKSKFLEFLGTRIKFTRELIERDLLRNHSIQYSEEKMLIAEYRPFVAKFNYYDSQHRITHEPYQTPQIFGQFGRQPNLVIALNVNGKEFRVLATNRLFDLHYVGDTQCLPLYRFDSTEHRNENITDWAVDEFYKRGGVRVSKEEIFHYVYAVLHYPSYLRKYEQNLKREFPRIPVYKDVPYWVELGRQLTDLHVNYEAAEPYPLEEKTVEPPRGKKNASAPDLFAEGPFVPKAVTKLRANKEIGVIEIDSYTRLEGIPAIAWEYKLGSRSALEWVLDQYKERKPKDSTIAEKFNTYRFADHKNHVIDLLKRVCTVSVKTMEIINSMADEEN